MKNIPIEFLRKKLKVGRSNEVRTKIANNKSSSTGYPETHFNTFDGRNLTLKNTTSVQHSLCVISIYIVKIK